MSNFALAFGEALSENMKRQLLRRTFMHFGAFVSESLNIIPKLTKENLERYLRVENLEMLKHALSQNKGVIIVSAHLGNWELGSHALQLLGIPLSVVAREFRNPFINSFIRFLRESRGQEVVPKWGMTRKIIAALKQGKAVAILADQYARAEGAMVDFFGTPASTTRSVALLALRFHSPIIPAFVVREGGKYVCYIDSPVDSGRDCGPMSVEEITACITKRIEAYVRRYPTQWTWFHRRWKMPGRKQRHG